MFFKNLSGQKIFCMECTVECIGKYALNVLKYGTSLGTTSAISTDKYSTAKYYIIAKLLSLLSSDQKWA